MAVTLKKGDVTAIQHTASSTIGSGDVVVLGTAHEAKARIGVALVNIASGATGSVAVTGCFTFPKVAAAVIAQGESVGWDASEEEVDDNLFQGGSPGDVVEFGMADTAAAALSTSVDVWIDQPGTLISA